jgi:hypothetical protein
MNNESGSALQKASFVLLMFIAAALAYLIVRDRIRANQQRDEAERIAAVAPSTALQTTPRPFNPAEMKSSFAPIRPRVETNTVRVPPSRPSAIQPPNSVPLNQTTGNDVVAGIIPAPANSFDRPVAVATTSGRAGLPGVSSVAGRVTLRGTPPAETPITLDPMCARLNPTPITTRHYVVGTDGGLANVFVYIKAGAPPSKAPQAGPPLLDNINCQFEPYVLGVRAGQPFQIRNSDPMLHNVHSLPKNAGNRQFNLGLPVTGMTQQKTFDKPEVLVQIKCDVHPWMFAYIGVVDHPWFAVTDSNGNFALPTGLPAGEYTIAAVHRKNGEAVQRVTISGGEVAPANFTFDLPESLAGTNAP